MPVEMYSPPRPSTPAPGVRFQKLKAEIHRQLVDNIDVSLIARWKPERLRREVRNLAVALAFNSPEMINEVERERLIEEVMAEAFALGPLEGFMNDPSISEIHGNGPNTVYIE